MDKPRIFLNVATYLPGYRGGGPTQSIKNMVNTLSDEFEFYIFTVNHDFGIKDPYSTIRVDSWNDCFGAKIFYSSDQKKKKNLQNILKQKQFSLIFLNSFFNTDTIKIIALYHQLKLKTPIVLMPRGELSKGALNIKRMKKTLYIKLVNSVHFLENVNYIATAQDEFKQIENILSTDKINMLSNIPNIEKKIILDTKEDNKLKLVFVSRITSKKNLDYALETLKYCQKKIIFDIYGTMEDKLYWSKCKKIIESLPDNIIVSYKGELANENVINTIASYDVFYFPTQSENYGHVISESLQASLPVLISDTTPWLDLEEKKYGWVYSLSTPSSFSKKLDELASLKNAEYNQMKKKIYKKFDVQTTASKVADEYKKVLKELIKYEK